MNKRKQLMNAKVAGIPLVIILILVVTIGGVVAVVRYSIEKSTSITVVVNSAKIEIYSNVECTIPMTTLAFPEVIEDDEQGTGSMVQFWIKAPHHQSEEDLWIRCYINGAVSSYLDGIKYGSTNWPNGDYALVLPAGTDIMSVEVQLQMSGAASGTYSGIMALSVDKDYTP